MTRLSVLLAVVVAACAPGTKAPNDAPSIATVHAGVCGNCHTRVEPGDRTRSELEAALSRHHRRVRLSAEEWHAMVDYLAKPAGDSTAHATR